MIPGKLFEKLLVLYFVAGKLEIPHY